MVLMKDIYTASRTPHGVRGLKSQAGKRKQKLLQSHPSRGAWIEMVIQLEPELIIVSHPSRGAWIEIPVFSVSPFCSSRRTPHGVRGLKCGCPPLTPQWDSRTPHGVRGLKS